MFVCGEGCKDGWESGTGCADDCRRSRYQMSGRGEGRRREGEGKNGMFRTKPGAKAKVRWAGMGRSGGEKGEGEGVGEWG